MGRTKGFQTSMEGWMMANAPEGTIFYSNKADREVTGIASCYQRKVKTERLIVVGGSQTKPTVDTITKVTLLNDCVQLWAEVINMGGI